MSDSVITVSNLTKDYGKNRGVFDISFDVRPGEVFGYLGTNGSGKTTTIRQMMGYVKPNGGKVRVAGLNPWKDAPKLMRDVSYVPGEIAFPNLSTGTAFLKVQAQYLKINDFTRMNHLIEVLALDPTANLKRMSKGMKQKTALVAALMGNKDILVMDEPTTGLDPLMRESFLELVREEKSNGHTVFMSSHIFEEIEDVCDRVAIIEDGHICEVIDLSHFRNTSHRQMEVCFGSEADSSKFAETVKKTQPEVNFKTEKNKVSCLLEPEQTGAFICALDGLDVVSLDESHMNLQQYFMKTYHNR